MLLMNDFIHVYAKDEGVGGYFPTIFGEEYISARNAETELLEFADKVIKEGTGRWKKFGQYDNHNEGGAFAPDYDGKIKFKVFDGDTLVIYGDGVMPDFTFQIDINGWELNSSIKEGKITRLAICGNITEIGNRNFLGFEKLRTVVLPPALKTIGREAFARCDSLKYLTLPDSLVTIKHKAFYNAALKWVCLPANVKHLEDEAFFCGTFERVPSRRPSRPSLEKVVAPDSIDIAAEAEHVFRFATNDDVAHDKKPEPNIRLKWKCVRKQGFISIIATADHNKKYVVDIEVNPDYDESPEEIIMRRTYEIYRDFYPDAPEGNGIAFDGISDAALQANYDADQVRDLIADLSELIEYCEDMEN